MAEPLDPYSPFEWMFRRAEPLSLGELGMVGLLAYVLADHPRAAAALFRAYLEGAVEYDRGRQLSLLESNQLAPAFAAALDDLVAGKLAAGVHGDVDIRVATEIPMTAAGITLPDEARTLGEADLSISAQLMHPDRVAPHIQGVPRKLVAQLIVEAKLGERLSRVGQWKEEAPEPRLERCRNLLQPAGYAGAWTTYPAEHEATVRVVGTLGSTTDASRWHDEYREQFGDVELSQQVAVAQDMKWGTALQLVRDALGGEECVPLEILENARQTPRPRKR